MSTPYDWLTTVPLEYEGLILAFNSANRILTIFSEQSDLQELALSLIVHRDSGDLIPEIDLVISIHQPNATTDSEPEADVEAEDEVETGLSDDGGSTTETSDQNEEFTKEIKELFDVNFDFEIPSKFSTEPASLSQDPSNRIWIKEVTQNGIATV